MSWQAVFFEQREIGQRLQQDGFLVFFGNNLSQPENLKQAFPHLHFHTLKQVHGSQVVASSADAVEADAHWTIKRNTALIISTADCLPILAYSKKSGVCVAIHAGWRGLVDGVIPQALEILSNAGDLRAWVGPHIHAESFEVGDDVAQILQSAFRKAIGKKKPEVTSILIPHAESGKKYVDLSLLAKMQLQASGLAPERIRISKINTWLNPRFFSFRRDHTQSRQSSFIARL